MRHTRIRTLASLTLLVVALGAAAHTQSQNRSQPSPKMKRLEFLVGKWKDSSTNAEALSFDNVWLLGGRYLQMRSKATLKEMGMRQSLAILGYDPERKHYRLWVFSSTDPMPDECAGELAGSQLILVGRQREPNVEVRLTFEARSQRTFLFRSEVKQGEVYVKEQERLFTRER